jgi:hypothetical protein
MSQTALNNLFRFIELLHWFWFYIMLFSVIGLSKDVSKLQSKIKRLESKNNE